MLFPSLAPLIQHGTHEYDVLAYVTQHPDRPKPNREIDQIFMLPGSQLTQVKLAAPLLAKKSVTFIGDGDSMALSIGVLGQNGILAPDMLPNHMRVLDFDIRIVSFINQVAKELGIQDNLVAETYNVKDPIPDELSERSDIFYVNPPYGSSNEGFSCLAFLSRGAEASKRVGSQGIAIVPYSMHLAWTYKAMRTIQGEMLKMGYIVSEMIPSMHKYHLDDSPELRSGTVVFDRIEASSTPFHGIKIPTEKLDHFYGSQAMDFPVGVAESGELDYQTQP